MAEKQGFFRRIFSFASSPEDKRVTEHGVAPRSSDTLVGVTPGAPDADLHQPAMADTLADSEAGGSPDGGGGITPLKEMEAQGRGEAGTAEKKTPH